MATVLGNAIDFMQDFGFFDVILPFLLVFTIIFGILEKTRIFGEEKIGDKSYPKKNLNSMVAFVIAFFVLAAKQVVTSLQLSLPYVALVLVILLSFMMLAGSFMGDKTFSFENSKWVVFLTLVSFIAVLLIFLNSFGWFHPIVAFFGANPSTVLIPTLLVGVVIGTIIYVVGSGPAKESKS